jgi:hypothetical protein
LKSTNFVRLFVFCLKIPLVTRRQIQFTVWERSGESLKSIVTKSVPMGRGFSGLFCAVQAGEREREREREGVRERESERERERERE